MALNNSNEAIIDKRREAVALLLLGGKTQRQIAALLPTLQPPIQNEDGTPYSAATVNLDIKAIRAEWRRNAQEKIEEHLARQLARTEQLYDALQKGIQAGSPRAIEVAVKILERQSKLIGADKPEKKEYSGPDGGEIPIKIRPINYRAVIADLAPRPMGDSDAPGES